MKKLGKDTFNERLKQTMFENEIQEAIQPPKLGPKPSPKNYLKVKVMLLQKRFRPRKMRQSEKFALASLLTYVVYMMQMAQHF